MHSTTFDPIDLTSSASSVSIDGHDAASVTIPDAHFLFHADFKRTGSDLTLTGEDGHRVVVPGYFTHEHLPTLLSPEGAALTGDVVDALVGSQAPDQYAQAGTQVQTSPLAIGRVATVQGGATAVRNGVAVALNVGDVVLKGDVVQTAGGNSAVGVIFTDGTTFNLSSNARMVLNEFVYSKGGTANSALINLVQGSITFIAGEVAHTGDMRIGTPAATMGIRGTMVQVDIDVNNGQIKLAVLVEPNGVTGAFNVYSLDGQLLGIVNDASITALVTPQGPLQATFTQVFKTPAELQDALSIVQKVVQTQSVGAAILAQQPLNPNQHAAGTQITTSHSDLSTTKIEVSLTTTGTDTVTITDLHVVPPPPGAPPTIPFIPLAETHTPIAPFVAHEIANQCSPEDTAWSFQVPLDTFADPDSAFLTLTATLANGDALPYWLTFNAATGTFEGTPPLNFNSTINGDIDIKVTASDGALTVSDVFKLHVTPVNDPPTIHTPADGIHYWASNTTGNVTPINHISFADVDAFNTPVHVTFSMNDCGDALNACHLLGSGVTVVSGDGTSQITLEGSIADINAYLLNGNLLWNPDGANNHEMGQLKIEIDDNGCLPGGNVVCSTVLISEICNPDFSGCSVNDFSQVNFTNISNVCAGGGNDEITTSFSHQGATTTYDGGSGNDTIHLLFTPDQLAEILADPQMRCDLRSFVNDPCGETLDLCGSSWNAKAQNFEHADVNLVSGDGSGIVADLNGLTPDAEFIIGTCGNDTLSGCLTKSNVIVGLDGCDQLTGGNLSDVLLGGAGNDILIGGLGNDVLSGSTGANTFKFLEMSGASANFGKDVIVDFHLGQDTIELDHSLFANYAALQAAISEDCHGNAVITADCNNSITLAGVSMAAIVAHQADIHLV